MAGKGKKGVGVRLGWSKRVKFSMIGLYVDSKEEGYRLSYALKLSSAIERMHAPNKNRQERLVGNFEADI